MKKQKEITILNANEWFWKLILKNTKKQVRKEGVEKLPEGLRFIFGDKNIDVFYNRKNIFNNKGENIFAYQFSQEYIELSNEELSKIKEVLLKLATNTLSQKIALKGVNRLIKKYESGLNKNLRKIETIKRKIDKLQYSKRNLSNSEIKSRKIKIKSENKMKKIYENIYNQFVSKRNSLLNLRDKIVEGVTTPEDIFKILGDLVN